MIVSIIACLGLFGQLLLDFFVKEKKKKLHTGIAVFTSAVIGIWVAYVVQNKDNEELQANLKKIEHANLKLQSTLDLRDSDLVLIRTQNDSLKSYITLLSNSQKGLQEIVNRKPKFKVFLNNLVVEDNQVVLIPTRLPAQEIEFTIQNVGDVPAPEFFACITYPKRLKNVKHDKWTTGSPPGGFHDNHIEVQKDFEHILTGQKFVIDKGMGVSLWPLKIPEPILGWLLLPLTLEVTIPNGPLTIRRLDILFYNGEGKISTSNEKWSHVLKNLQF